MKSLEELPIPDSVVNAKTSAEMARIWIADNSQVVILSDRLWKDPGSWGLMLADLAKHVANAYASKGLDVDETLKRIRGAMDAEWASPTD